MKSNSIDTSCGFNGDFVSYLYNELGADERTVFESHLVDCTACTDEFAALADDRFSVYEWHKEEFVPMASPVISIPYDRPATAFSGAGVLASVRELFALSRWPVATAAILAVVIGAGLVAVYLMPAGEHIAANVEQDLLPQPTLQDPAVNNPVDPISPNQTKSETGAAGPEGRVFRPVKSETAVRRPIPKRQIISDTRSAENDIETRPKSLAAQRNSELPVLNSYEDEDDRSLRLADLIDDGGSGS